MFETEFQRKYYTIEPYPWHCRIAKRISMSRTRLMCHDHALNRRPGHEACGPHIPKEDRQ